MVGKSAAEMFRGEQPGPETRARVDARPGGEACDRLLALHGGPAAPGQPRHARARRQRPAAYSETNAESRKRLYEQLKSLLPKLDMNEGHLFHRFAYMKNEIPVAGVAHQAGTCRFGTDPASSVLNTDCRAHEVDNLYVVDTSIFPSIGAVNPALTAMANSLRVGDHLLERLGAERRLRQGSTAETPRERGGRPPAIRRRFPPGSTG